MSRFQDRSHAGRRLAERLAHLVDDAPVVLGLPRGGAVVAAAVAESLAAALDVVVVRRIPAPGQPELAVGAVTDSRAATSILNNDLLEALDVEADYLRGAIAEELREVQRCRELYRRGAPAVPIAGRTVIVVDDGIATGATMQMALEAVRAGGPERIVLATPVAAPSALAMLQGQVDELLCLESPADFRAVGCFYERFDQVTDDQVVALLGRSVA